MEAEAQAGAEQVAPQAAPQPAGTWYSGMDEDTVAFAENKGWLSDDPQDAFTRIAGSYKNVEKMVGGRIKVPEQGDEEGWNDLFNRLGRPEAPDQYNIPAEGANEELLGWFREAAHATGMTDTQAQVLVNKWNEFNQNAVNAQISEADAMADQEINNLRAEWGTQYDDNIELGRRAVQAANVDQDTLESIEAAIGPSKLLKLFAYFGKGVAEDSYVEGGKVGSASARDQLESLKADPVFMGRYMKGDPAALETFGNLLAKAG